MTPANGCTVLSVNDRSGKVKITSLLLLLIVAAAVYSGIAFGKVPYHKYRIRDAMDGQLSLAGQIADETIHRQLTDKLAKMSIPAAAKRVRMQRTGARTIQVSIVYKETVNLLVTKKEIPVSIVERRTY
jgi:hypothetical protein